MEKEIKKRPREILTIQEYLDRRKENQTIDQKGAECYDT